MVCFRFSRFTTILCKYPRLIILCKYPRLVFLCKYPRLVIRVLAYSPSLMDGRELIWKHCLPVGSYEMKRLWSLCGMQVKWKDITMLSLCRKNASSHDSSVGESHCLFFPWLGFNSQPWQSILRDFFLADHILCQPVWDSITKNGSVSPHTACGQREGRPKLNYGQAMAEKMKWMNVLSCILFILPVILLPSPYSHLSRKRYPYFYFMNKPATSSWRVIIVNTARFINERSLKRRNSAINYALFLNILLYTVHGFIWIVHLEPFLPVWCYTLWETWWYFMPYWQSSIRHALYQKWFRKITVTGEKIGNKGCFWAINHKNTPKEWSLPIISSTSNSNQSVGRYTDNYEGILANHHQTLGSHKVDIVSD